jgi:myo-inositol-1(or 4)-monophosphatase
MPEPMDLQDLLEVAVAAALAGGRLVRDGARAARAEEKGAGDYVTEVDRASEETIRRVLADGAPGVPVLGEEAGGDVAAAARYWAVDPLDGTTNFLHGFPAVGVSVALVEDGRPLLGVIHAPFLGETYVGGRGLGARAIRPDGAERELRVSERPPERAVVGTGFPFRRKDELLEPYLAVFSAALARFEDLRRPGAASLDLAWVAAGVFEGFFELGLSAWDVAAGAVLIEEAGGVVTDWSGGRGYLSGDILAASRDVHRELLVMAHAGGRTARHRERRSGMNHHGSGGRSSGRPR